MKRNLARRLASLANSRHLWQPLITRSERIALAESQQKLETTMPYYRNHAKHHEPVMLCRYCNKRIVAEDIEQHEEACIQDAWQEVAKDPTFTVRDLYPEPQA